MPVLPFDLILTVGMSAAVFVLGFIVWASRRSAAGNVVYGLMAMGLAMWVSADWFVHALSAYPSLVFFWKLFFYACVSFGPALGAHAGAAVVHRRMPRRLAFMYAGGFFVFWLLVLGAVIRMTTGSLLAADGFFVTGASVGVCLYALALITVSMELYPVLHLTSASLLERRRAAYGALILVPFLITGGLQLVVGPIPTGFLMPVFAVWFFIFSLLAFSRVSLFDVEVRPLEGFLLLLLAFAIIMILRSRDWIEVLGALSGALVVGLFGLLAVRTVRVERTHRQVLEATNRQLKRVEEAKGDFVDMVAHQLRGPLGGIRSAASMLHEGDYGPLPPKARDASMSIFDSSTRLLSLADTFLDASRLELGRYKSVRISTAIREEVQAVVDEMRASASMKGLQLSLSVAESVPASLILDRDVLHQALFNLLDNAIKYTEEGKIDVVCRIDQKFVCEVKDTGQGMTPEEIHHLFQKFHRGRMGHAHAVDGTGLGLYIVKRLVEAAGGTITASSDGPDHGSRFMVELPVELESN